MRASEFSAKVRRAAWNRCGGNCEDCGQKIIGRGEVDHVVPLGLGGESTLENAKFLCSKCHRLKTRQDVAIMRKADRQGKKHLGLKKPRNPVPGSRGTKWKRKMDGTVEKRT